MRLNRYVLTQEAKQDLLSIRRYGVNTWGELHSDRYINGLKVDLKRLLMFPLMGSELEDFPGLRRWNYQNHIVFYTVEEKHLSVKRILHSRQEPLRHVRYFK